MGLEETLNHFSTVIPEYLYNFKDSEKREISAVQELKSILMKELDTLKKETRLIKKLESDFVKQNTHSSLFLLDHLFYMLKPSFISKEGNELLQKIKDLKDQSLTQTEKSLLLKIKKKTRLTQVEQDLLKRFEILKEVQLSPLEKNRLPKVQAMSRTLLPEDKKIILQRLKEPEEVKSPEEEALSPRQKLLQVEKKLFQKIEELKENYFTPKERKHLEKIENLGESCLSKTEEALLKKIETLQTSRFGKNEKLLQEIQRKKEFIKKVNFYLKTCLLNEDPSFQAACLLIPIQVSYALKKLGSELSREISHFDKYQLILEKKIKLFNFECLKDQFLEKSELNGKNKLDFLEKVGEKICEETDEKLQPTIKKIMFRVVQFVENKSARQHLQINKKVVQFAKDKRTQEKIIKPLPTIEETEEKKYLEALEEAVLVGIREIPLAGIKKEKVFKMSEKLFEDIKNGTSTLTEKIGYDVPQNEMVQHVLTYFLNYTRPVPEKASGSSIDRSLKRAKTSDSLQVAKIREVNLKTQSRSAEELSPSKPREIVIRKKHPIRPYLDDWKNKLETFKPRSPRELKKYTTFTAKHIAQAYRENIRLLLTKNEIEVSLLDAIVFHLQIELWRTKTAFQLGRIKEWENEFETRFITALENSEEFIKIEESVDIREERGEKEEGEKADCNKIIKESVNIGEEGGEKEEEKTDYNKIMDALTNEFIPELIKNKYINKYMNGQLNNKSPRPKAPKEAVNKISESKKETNLRSAGG